MVRRGAKGKDTNKIQAANFKIGARTGRPPPKNTRGNSGGRRTRTAAIGKRPAAKIHIRVY